MAVSIGINPITWTNDDMPELGRDIPLETCLAETRTAGYAGTEMGGKFPRRTADLRPLLARHGLTLVSGWFSGRLLERGPVAEAAAIADHLALLTDMGCSVVVYAETTGSVQADRSTPVSQRPTLPDADWPTYGRQLTKLAELMAESGIALAYHHHMGTIVQTEAEVDRLMASTGDAVRLLLDTGHCVYAGGDPVAMARRHAPRIAHVHCKDVRRPVLDRVLAEDTSFLDAVVDGVFTVPGDGMIDFAPVLRVLAGAGYVGWLVVEAEQDPAKAHPLTYARLGFETLDDLARGAGMKVVA